MKSRITFRGNGDVEVLFSAETDAETRLLGAMADRSAAIVEVDFEGYPGDKKAKHVTIRWPQ